MRREISNLFDTSGPISRGFIRDNAPLITRRPARSRFRHECPDLLRTRKQRNRLIIRLIDVVSSRKIGVLTFPATPSLINRVPRCTRDYIVESRLKAIRITGFFVTQL